MIVSVRESKVRLSELVARANRGEDVVITVRGKPSARIVPLLTGDRKPDMSAWAAQIESRLSDQKTADSSGEIIESLRGERW